MYAQTKTSKKEEIKMAGRRSGEAYTPDQMEAETQEIVMARKIRKKSKKAEFFSLWYGTLRSPGRTFKNIRKPKLWEGALHVLVSSIVVAIITVFNTLGIAPTGLTDIFTVVMATLVLAPVATLLAWFVSALVIHAIASYAFRLKGRFENLAFFWALSFAPISILISIIGSIAIGILTYVIAAVILYRHFIQIRAIGTAYKTTFSRSLVIILIPIALFIILSVAVLAMSPLSSLLSIIGL